MATGTAETRTNPIEPVPAVAHGLVRKTIAAQALVVSWREESATTQAVTLHWPGDHGFYTTDGRYSPLLVTESIRQALALLSHTVHEIPLDHRLGWERLRSTVNEQQLHTSSEPAVVELVITHTALTRRRFGSVHLSAHVRATRAGHPLATADLDYTTHPPAIYDRLRGCYADARQAFARALPVPPPVPPEHVGRHLTHDVVLSPTATPHTWQLRADTSHPVLFDHPHDHIPGMVLLEAAAQAARVETAPEPVDLVDFDSTFLRYVEFDRPCTLTARPGAPDAEGRSRIKVEARQMDHLVFTTHLTTRPRTAR
jgi:hypothetical protein